VFPEIPLGLDAELQVNGTWTDLIDYMDHGPVVIGRGHPDESTTVSPSTLEMTLTNSSGDFAGANPVSPFYPWLKQNTPLRVSIPAASSYLRSETDNSSGAQCPDASGLHVTGDLDIRVDVQLTDWQSPDLAFRWGTSDQSWFLQVTAAGMLQFFWSTTGSDFPSATSTAPLPAGRLTYRVTLQVSTGTVTFYTGPAGNADASTGWTQLGAAIVSGATSVFAGTATIGVGGFYGSMFELEVRSGIGGTVVAHPVFSAQTAGTTSFADAQGNTWSLSGTAEISDRDYRGHFEVPEWPQQEPEFQADEGTPDVLCEIEGGGLLRRYGQANTPLQSPMRRAYTGLSATAVAAAPVAYWPMEDAAAASQLASGLGGTPMYFSGSPTLASSTAFPCSLALPVANGASFTGRVPTAASWAANVTRFLMEVPSGGEASGAVIASAYSTGTIAVLQLSYDTGGALTLAGYSAAGAQLFTSGPVTMGPVLGGPLRVSMELQPSGSNVGWAMATLAPGAAAATVFTGTLTSATVGAVTQVALNPNGTLTGTAFGHCSVQAAWDTLFDLSGALNAWLAEAAGTRFQRLCSEEGIQFRGRGQLTATTLMGTQTIETLSQLLQECADADRGVWYELRQQLGWGYITRQALYNQPAALTLDHDQDHLSPWTSNPTQDDQQLLNDATITATSGSSARAYAAPGQPVTGGRLSTLPPPDGIGVYDSVPTPSVNTYRDSDLQQIASWMIHIGTVDQQRFPGISIDLANSAYPYFAQTVAMDLGDRLVIDNPPSWLGPDPVSQLCQGLKETLWAFDYLIEVNGVPETPYEVAQAGASHAGTAGSQLTAGYSATATSLSVTTTAGSIWTTSGPDFPFSVMVEGEEMTVTNISGASSPQTFAVARSVNGVVKSQASGAAVQVYTRPVAGL